MAANTSASPSLLEDIPDTPHQPERVVFPQRSFGVLQYLAKIDKYTSQQIENEMIAINDMIACS